MNISFFTKGGGSGKIRGEQIAKHLGAKLNPKKGFKDDICIYVKCAPPKNYPKRTYIDVIEDSEGLRWVKSHPKVGIIASSVSIRDYLTCELNRNDIVLIPQHHCNFERIKRTRKKVTTAGIIGNKHSFQYSLDELEKKLEKIGMKLKTLIKPKFKDRHEVVDFYEQIDIQLIWRPNIDDVLKNPLKLVNAMSFGIPTIAYPEKNFVMELEYHFIKVISIDRMIYWVKELKDNFSLYERINLWGMVKAEEYHIDNIAKLYKKL